VKTASLALGIVALLVGLLWIGQGTGTVNWPASSFMIRQVEWAYFGAVLAIIGLMLIWRARR
jgi:NhaP-type Na+/H+ or K+/H+ antiporter